MSVSVQSGVLGVLVYAVGCAADVFVRMPNALHPVAWYGRATSNILRFAPFASAWRAAIFGAVLALALPAAAVGIVHGVFELARPWPLLHMLLQVIVLYSCASLFGLLDAAHALARTLREQGLAAARPKLAWLCSRDPSELDERGLANGTVESLAENLSDSVVAPLFFLVCFGVEGAVAYRAINTLDAMIGYRGRYEWLGKAAARLDDLANLVPARLTALLLAAAGVSFGRSSGLSVARGFAVWSRDRGNTESPNAGQPMAMAAGLLGVRLDKPGAYALGASLPATAPDDIPRAIDLCRRAGVLAWLCAGAGIYAFGLDGIYG